MNRDLFHILFSVVVFVPIVLLGIFSYPSKSEALSIFSPFGGKVVAWSPEAPGCAAITTAVSVATFGTINITVDQLIVGPPKAGTFGILRINGFTIPLLFTGYANHAYEVPNTWVLGNAFDVCGAIPFVRNILGKTVTDAICGIVGGTCPINKLIHKIGTGGPGGL